MIGKPTVTIDLRPLREFKAAVEDGGVSTKYPQITRALKQWAARYRGFIRERFDIFSKGGGNWAPLAPATIAARRKGKKRKKAKPAILRDTGVLFAALSPTFGKPGQIQEIIKFGVEVGKLGAATVSPEEILEAFDAHDGVVA